ncbi:unnamed protein product [Medioppia subpectinata]|uniref:MRH domain-containing protein n=1 Tax=Medioppia subpectinata TaxID=1979941 RepID=A0A7R9KDW7_9ACAR|nr:unnamed protein product [Medioppia subpectinata]CAG2101758.1 unnamed protein product [Medioppia subpectinata]
MPTDSPAVDLCGVSNGMDFSAFKTLSYNWTLTNSKNESIDYYINLCSLLNTTSDNTIPVNCSNSHICKYFRNGDKSAVVKLRPVCEEMKESHLNKTIKIHFICGTQLGTPEYFMDTKCSTNLKWKTPAVCATPAPTPPPIKKVHCVWDNGSHILDLTQLAMTTGNHFAVDIPTTTPSSAAHDFSIYYINICRPLNPIHEQHMSLTECGVNSAACKVTISGDHKHLNLGEPIHPPIKAFDGSISLFYENGSVCPADASKRISTRIKFECDPKADQVNPTVYEPGSEEIDAEKCVYLFEIRTAAVCDVIQPTKLDNNSCRYTDRITGLSVDLSSLKKPSKEPYSVTSEDGNTYELNVCGLVNSIGDPECYKSAVCMVSNKTQSSADKSAVSYGLLTSSAFYFDGTNLKLKHFNGSKCLGVHSDTGMMSSEIQFKCNPNAKNMKPKFLSEISNSCVAVFEWETHLVCSLQLPKCSIVGNDKFYNLRQLSSISHGWNTTDPNDPKTSYFVNVCTKLPTSIGCDDPNAAVCKCRQDSQKQWNCSQSLGDPSADELELTESGELQLTYRNGDSNDCKEDMKARTQILFKCSHSTGSPKFVEFIQPKCIYKFEWLTFMACPVNELNDELSAHNGFLLDERINSYINIHPLLNKTYNVKEYRVLPNNETDNYTYVMNLNTFALPDSNKCSEAAICQTKGTFNRDIGSLASIKYYLRGHELQIVLKSSNSKCGKNPNKNVTTIFRLHCSSSAGVGEPTFMYESNDCDYTFNWETELICADHFLN